MKISGIKKFEKPVQINENYIWKENRQKIGQFIKIKKIKNIENLQNQKLCNLQIL